MNDSVITKQRKTAVDLPNFLHTMPNHKKPDGNGNLSEGSDKDDNLPSSLLSPRKRKRKSSVSSGGFSPDMSRFSASEDHKGVTSQARRRKNPPPSNSSSPSTSDEAPSLDTSKEQELQPGRGKLQKKEYHSLTFEYSSSSAQCCLNQNILGILAWALSFIIFGIVFILVFGQGSISDEKSTPLTVNKPNSTKDEKEALKKLEHLVTHFSGQSTEFWNSLKAGIRDLFRDKKPLVSLLVYKHKDSELAHCLAYKMVKSVFENATSIQTSSLSYMKDYGSLIEQLQGELLTKKGVFLENLNDLPKHLAMALHVVCDREDPLVQGTMVVMTLEVTNLDTEGAFDSLTNMWEKSVNQDKLPALLTRIVSRVFPVNSQEELPLIC